MAHIRHIKMSWVQNPIGPYRALYLLTSNTHLPTIHSIWPLWVFLLSGHPPTYSYQSSHLTSPSTHPLTHIRYPIHQHPPIYPHNPPIRPHWTPIHLPTQPTIYLTQHTYLTTLNTHPYTHTTHLLSHTPHLFYHTAHPPINHTTHPFDHIQYPIVYSHGRDWIYDIVHIAYHNSAENGRY